MNDILTLAIAITLLSLIVLWAALTPLVRLGKRRPAVGLAIGIAMASMGFYALLGGWRILLL